MPFPRRGLTRPFTHADADQPGTVLTVGGAQLAARDRRPSVARIDAEAGRFKKLGRDQDRARASAPALGTGEHPVIDLLITDGHRVGIPHVTLQSQDGAVVVTPPRCLG